MIRSFRSELLKLRRPSVIFGGGAVLAGFTVLATVLTFTTATATATAAQNGRYATSTFAGLAGANGLTRGFANAAGLLGILVFVLFLTSMTSEYSHGTLRMLLTRQPRRARLLGGKFLALVAVTAAAMMAALLLSAAVAIPLAHSRGIATTAWFTVGGLGHLASNYGNAVLAVVFFGTAGFALAVLLRSTVLALGVGLAWLLPLENIVQNSWAGSGHWLPGLLFGAVGRGGTDIVSYQVALALALAYCAIALTVASASFLRRDVTA
ncbi:MAG TPA: ABC transporter permease [Streptosporangiaceae bacterium]|nr:ABC transporter permease [Streptosporangiaceae bacterium]